MPAVSEKQRRYLYMKFGAEWVKRHHFDNKGKLPVRASKRGANALMEAHRRSKRKR